MKSVFLALVLFAAVAFGQLTINTPANVVECQPILLTWTGGTAPYFVSVLPGSQPSAAALINFGQQTGTSLTWVVNIAAGTSVGLTIRDNTGTTASSAPFTINPGTTTCLSSSGSASTPAGSSTSGAPVPSPSTPATTTTTSSTPTTTATTPASSPASSRASGATTTTSASGAAKTGGASVNMANMGVAGVVGAAVMAILA